MAAYLSLAERATGEVYTDARLVELDERLCAIAERPVLPVDWCEGWMDTLGFHIAASGKPLGEFLPDYIARAHNERRKRMAQWLLDNFENSSFYGR